MILAYVTMCILKLHTCAPEVVIQAVPFENTTECWEAVHDFMDHNPSETVTLTFRCGEEA